MENPEIGNTQGLSILKNPKVEETAISEQEDPYLRVYTLIGSQGSSKVDKSQSRDLNLSNIKEKHENPSTQEGLPSTNRGIDTIPTA